MLMERCMSQKVTNTFRPLVLSPLMLPWQHWPKKVSSHFSNFRLWSSHYRVTDVIAAAVTIREVRLSGALQTFPCQSKRQDVCATRTSGVVCFSCSSSLTSRCMHPIGGTAIYLWKSGRQLSAKQFPKYTFHLSVEKTPHCAQRNR